MQKIKAYDDTRVIFLSRDLGGSYSFYSFSNGNLSAKRIHMANGSIITDFAILEDSIYFAGFMQSGAFIGRFHIDAFMFSLPIEYYFLPQTLVTTSKIVAYRGPSDNTVHVVTLAQDANSNSVIVELKNHQPNNTYNWVGKYSGILFEAVKDIDFDDKYLVTVGRHPADAIVLRQFYRDDITMQSVYAPFPTASGYTCGSDICLEHIEDYKYAVVCSLVRDSNANRKTTRIQMFDMQSTPAFNYESDRSIHGYMDSLSEVKDIAYSEADNDLLVLMRSKNVGGVDRKDFLAYVPLSIPPNNIQVSKAVYFDCYSPSYPVLSGICECKPKHYMLVGTEPNYGNIFLFAKNKPYENQMMCNKFAEIKVDGANVNSGTGITTAITYSSFTYEWVYAFNSTPTNELFGIDCFD